MIQATQQMLWKSVEELENRDGALYFDGCTARELADRFGTPLYVYSQNRILANYRRLLNSYRKHYPNFQVYYAIKANNNPALVGLLGQAGAGGDASCIPEILIAEKAGIPASKILYSAVYPTENDLRFAIQKKVQINIEDISQIDILAKIGMPKFLCLRINPGIGGSGIKGLVFAGPDAKFGIPEQDVEKAFSKAKLLGVERFGIHMMTGSNILAPDYFETIVERLIDIAGPISRKLGIRFELIDLGGSLGVPYMPGEEEIDIDATASKAASMLKAKLAHYQMGEPLLIHEPGRYLMSDAGILLTRVTAIKRGTKTFIGLDAGMHTLLRPALYDAYHHVLYADNLEAPADMQANLVGQICESTDTFAKDRMIPSQTKVGDLFAFLNAGAYGFCMSSQYNSQPKAAEVIANQGQACLIRQRETFEDIVKGTHAIDYAS